VSTPSNSGAEAMYRKILVAVENSPADRTILSHVR
jgi:hypothetical protein